MKQIKTAEDYQLIPIDKIDNDARKIAVKWVEHFTRAGLNIEQKHKLASDIMNYHKAKVEETVKDIKRRIISLETDKEEYQREYINCGNENQKDFLAEQNSTASLMIKSYNEILNKLLKE